MKRRSAALNFTVRIRASLLHELVQRAVVRAYDMGAEDGEERKNASRVEVPPELFEVFRKSR